MAQGLSDIGKKWVTIKGERRDRRSSYYGVLQPRNSVKLLTVTVITDSRVFGLLSYNPDRPKTPSSPLFACTTPRLPQAEARVSKKPNSSPQGDDSTARTSEDSQVGSHPFRISGFGTRRALLRTFPFWCVFFEESSWLQPRNSVLM